MEQRQLAWLITTRSQVRVLVPQPRKVPQFCWGIFLGLCILEVLIFTTGEVWTNHQIAESVKLLLHCRC